MSINLKVFVEILNHYIYFFSIVNTQYEFCVKMNE